MEASVEETSTDSGCVLVKHGHPCLRDGGFRGPDLGRNTANFPFPGHHQCNLAAHVEMVETRSPRSTNSLKSQPPRCDSNPAQGLQLLCNCIRSWIGNRNRQGVCACV